MDNELLQFLIKKPEEPKGKEPAIFLLHGYGSDMDDLYGLAGYLPKNAYIFSLQAPYELAFGGYAWYNLNITFDNIRYDFNEVLSSVERIENFIKNVKEKYDLDPGRIILLGFSQGAILSYTLSMINPGKIKAVLAMSGYIPEEVKNYKIEDELKTKYFAAHGTHDDVIPVKLARESKEFMEAKGLDFEYNEYPMPHGISPEALNDAVVWLDKQINDK